MTVVGSISEYQWDDHKDPRVLQHHHDRVGTMVDRPSTHDDQVAYFVTYRRTRTNLERDFGTYQGQWMSEEHGPATSVIRYNPRPLTLLGHQPLDHLPVQNYFNVEILG